MIISRIFFNYLKIIFQVLEMDNIDENLKMIMNAKDLQVPDLEIKGKKQHPVPVVLVPPKKVHWEDQGIVNLKLDLVVLVKNYLYQRIWLWVRIVFLFWIITLPTTQLDALSKRDIIFENVSIVLSLLQILDEAEKILINIENWTRRVCYHCRHLDQVNRIWQIMFPIKGWNGSVTNSTPEMTSWRPLRK